MGITREGPAVSFRQGAAGDMAGSIFMSNRFTRDQCFQARVFSLPLEYQSFVTNVRKGMPLFLFDNSLRKLYGVFEAASDGGLNICDAGISYPAQVRIKIIWKCRPLIEDEFFPAIEDNYYHPRKFYFDLSYDQVVRLYELFDDRRVERPIHDYPKNESLEINHSSKGILDKESLTLDVPECNDQSRLSVPNILEVARRYSTPTSVQTDSPLSVEAYPNMLMPLRTETFGTQIAPNLSHHDQVGVHSQRELFPTAPMTDAVSTHVSAPCSQTSRNYQMVAKQSYLLPQDYPHNTLPSGCTAKEPRGDKFVANQSYPLSRGYSHNGSLTFGYANQNPTYKGSNHLNSTFTPYDRLYPQSSLSNPQSNSDYQVPCDICFKQDRTGAHNNIYACEPQCFSGEALPQPKLSKLGIPTYPEAERDGKAVPAIYQQKTSSTDCIQILDCDQDFKNDRMKKHGTCSNTSDSLDLENGILNPRHTIGAESNRKKWCNLPQTSVFSRLSLNKQLTSQETTGPTVNQLVSSLSQKTEEWNHKNRPTADGFIPLIREQAMDCFHAELNLPSHSLSQKTEEWNHKNRSTADGFIPLIREQAMDCFHAELNLPSQLELEEEEQSIEPQLPYLNFKRRSKTGEVDATLGKESGKIKRRKLVRPSFGENKVFTNFGEELKRNCTQNMDQNYQEVGKDHIDIDLNVPAASVDSDLLEEDNRSAACPSVIKIQTEKPHETDMNKPINNSDVMETTKQDPSVAPAQKVSIEFNIADLNTMDESKLRTILDQTSSLLLSLGKLKSGKSNDYEEARSSVFAMRTLN